MEIFTIGFAGKSAPTFFGILKQAGICRLIDVRVNNTSQLAGFTKSDSLPFFLHEILNIDYVHEPLLAPEKEAMSAFKKGDGDWPKYERAFIKLLDKRKVADKLDRTLFDRPAVLLCSESTPEHCHRRLVAEYLSAKWGNVRITHL